MGGDRLGIGDCLGAVCTWAILDEELHVPSRRLAGSRFRVFLSRSNITNRSWAMGREWRTVVLNAQFKRADRGLRSRALWYQM